MVQIEYYESSIFDATPERVYYLTGVICHYETASSDHYFAFIKELVAPYLWLDFNDGIIRETKPEVISKKCIGG